MEVTTTWSSEHKVSKITTGKTHSLFLFDNGDVFGCGGASCGQLGLGSGKRALEDILTPVRISNLSDIRDISCGADFSLACCRQKGLLYSFGHPEVS